MKDVFERVITLIPQYIADITGLISGPKRFVLQRKESGDSHLVDALVFLGISFLIGWVLKISFLKLDPLMELAGDAVFVALEVMAFGAALCLAWRVVKGHADIKTLFVIHFYYSGVLKIITASSFMSMAGVLRASDAQFYGELMEAVSQGQVLNFAISDIESFSKSNAAIPMVVVTCICLFVILVWTVAIWGAYRVVNHLSRFRSTVAFMLFVLFGIPITAFVTLIANAGVR